MGKATRRKFAAVLLLAGATAGCTAPGSLSAWMPWPKKQDQGLSWATPDMSKSYGKNQIGAERGGSFEPRSEMPSPPPTEGGMARFTSAVTKPVKAMAAAFKKSETAASTAEAPVDPKGGAAIYASIAQVQEKQGNLAAAVAAYERALQTDSANLEALLGFARLRDRQGDFARATQLYKTAGKLHPKESAVFNDLGLCLSRQGKRDEACDALAQAVRLRPERALYRNNLAKMLVDAGQPQQAFEQLAALNPPAKAHYNLGYLLQQKRETALARQHFARAVELDPQLADARQWLAAIDGQQVAEAPSRPAHNQGVSSAPPAAATAPAAMPAPLVPPVVPAAQQRVSMDVDFYLPSRY